MKSALLFILTMLIGASAHAGRTICTGGQLTYSTSSQEEGAFIDNAVVEELKFDGEVIQQIRIKRGYGGRLEINAKNPSIVIEKMPSADEEPVVGGMRFTLELTVKTPNGEPYSEYFARPVVLECTRYTKVRLDERAPQNTKQAQPLAK